MYLIIYLTAEQNVTCHSSHDTGRAAANLKSVAPAVSSQLAAGTLCQYLLQWQHLLIVSVVGVSQQLVQGCSLPMSSGHCNGTAHTQVIYWNISIKKFWEELMTYIPLNASV